MRTRPIAALVALFLAVLVARPVGAADDKAAAPPAWVYPQDWKCAGRRLTMHEPQVVAYDAAGGKVTLRFPATLTDPLGRSSFGMAEVLGTLHVDLSSRLMKFDLLAAGSTAFPAAAPADAKAVQGAFGDALPKSLLLRLELLTARPGAYTPEATPPKFAKEPPQILVRKRPAVLVQVDGDPVLLDVEGIAMQYLANSASDVFRDPKSDLWYLVVDGTWLQAKALAGPWKKGDGTVPSSMSQLPGTHPRSHVRRFIPGTPEFAKRGIVPAPKELPEVIVTDKPAELVMLYGDPLFAFVPGVPTLLSAMNTESDLFLHLPTNLYYLLISGRWFSAPATLYLEGPWTLVEQLPEDFAKIPRDNTRGHVVWCVPGTPEASEACAFAALEERGTLNKFTPAQVLFEPDGKAPVTAPLEGDVKQVTNTEDDVFAVGKAFWVCQSGAWFRSDDGVTGWKPCADVPEALRKIPETSGAYHANFCRPLGFEGETATYAVRGGYHGVFVSKGAPVYGTGSAKRGMVRKENWYPWPRTYGENRWYDPVTGLFQPRSVHARADGTTSADEWSPYTASYGRVRRYGSRYEQGGRRMFPYSEDELKFDTSAGRPDVYGVWMAYEKKREGFDLAAFPFGDRSAETPPADARLATDETGKVWRIGAKGPETNDKGTWTSAKAPPEIVAWLETLARIDARPALIARWREQRAAPVPVYATVTDKAK